MFAVLRESSRHLMQSNVFVIGDFCHKLFLSKVVFVINRKSESQCTHYALELCEIFLPLRIFKPASRVYANGAQRCARLTKMPENTTCKHSAQQTTDSLSVLSRRCNGWVNHLKTARFEGGSSSGVLTQKTNESNIYVCWESNGRKVGAFTALCDLR